MTTPHTGTTYVSCGTLNLHLPPARRHGRALHRAPLETRRGLTRGELLVVIAVLMAFALLLGPYLLSRRTSARRTTCEQRQINVAKALTAYDADKGHYPGYRINQYIDAPAAVDVQAIGWPFAILPQIEVTAGDLPAGDLTPQAIYDAHSVVPPDARPPDLPAVLFPAYLCPADERPFDESSGPLNSFIANCGQPDAADTSAGPADWPGNGVLLDGLAEWPYRPAANAAGAAAADAEANGEPAEPAEQGAEKAALADYVSRAYITEYDGLDNTLLASENLDATQWTASREPLLGFVWVDEIVDDQPAPGQRLLLINQRPQPGDGTYRFARPSSTHPGGVNVVYCSGRSQFLNENIDYIVFSQLMTSNASAARRPGTTLPVAEPYVVPSTPAP